MLCFQLYFYLDNLRQMVEVTVGHYRYSDDAYELPKTNSVESDVKARRPKFSVHHVQAVIEHMDEDLDEEFAELDVVMKRNQAGTHRSKRVTTAAHSGQSNKIRKSRSSDRCGGSARNKMGDALEDDVEPDDSPDEFVYQVTTKLKAFAADLGTDDTENRGGGARTRENKLSLRKNVKVPANDPVMPAVVKQKPTTKNLLDVTPMENVKALDMIESLSGSDSGDPFHFESKPSDIRPTSDQQKLEDAEMPKRACKVTPSNADKNEQTPVNQCFKSGSRTRKDLKYSKQSELLNVSEEIIVEEDESEVADEDFLSLVSGSPAAASVKGRTPSKKLTSSFWLTSPESRKSVYNTDDDEFVSNSASYKRSFVVTWFCICCSGF